MKKKKILCTLLEPTAGSLSPYISEPARVKGKGKVNHAPQENVRVLISLF